MNVMNVMNVYVNLLDFFRCELLIMYVLTEIKRFTLYIFVSFDGHAQIAYHTYCIV